MPLFVVEIEVDYTNKVKDKIRAGNKNELTAILDDKYPTNRILEVKVIRKVRK